MQNGPIPCKVAGSRLCGKVEERVLCCFKTIEPVDELKLLNAVCPTCVGLRLRVWASTYGF
jgi:hypothetical protein